MRSLTIEANVKTSHDARDAYQISGNFSQTCNACVTLL